MRLCVAKPRRPSFSHSPPPLPQLLPPHRAHPAPSLLLHRVRLRPRAWVRAQRSQQPQTVTKVPMAWMVKLLPLLLPLPFPPRRPSPSSRCWRCAATIVPGKRKPNPLPGEMAGPACDRASATHAPVATVATVASAAHAVQVAHAKRVVGSEKTEARAWATPHSVRNAKPRNVPKCRCANWRHKRTVKP